MLPGLAAVLLLGGPVPALGGSAPAAVGCPLAEMDAAAKAPDRRRAASVLALDRRLRELAAGRPTACVSQLVGRYLFQQLRALHAFSEARGVSCGEQRPPERELRQAGWLRGCSEAGDHLKPDYASTLRRVGDVLPPDWTAYFQQRGQEIRTGFSEDASMLISFEELRGRILFWEKFLAQRPDFPWKDEIVQLQRDYLAAYLTGLDNTPIADRETGVLRDEVRRSYERFVKDNRGSAYQPIVAGYLQLLQEGGRKVTDEARAFLRKKEVADMTDVQPRLY